MTRTNGRIVAAAKSDPPFTSPCIFDNTCANYTGINFEVFQAAMEMLNFEYTLVQAEEGESGFVDEQGNWRGMVGQLLRGEINMTASLISVDEKRMSAVDFSVPASYYMQGFLVRRSEASEAFAMPTFLATPFSNEVWMLVMLSLFLYFLVTFCWKLLESKRSSFGKDCPQVLSDSFLLVVRTTFSQCEDSQPGERISKRVLMMCFQIPLFFLINIYMADLTSTLMSWRPPRNPFSSFSELAFLIHAGVYTLVDLGTGAKWRPTNDTSTWSDDPTELIRIASRWNPPVTVPTIEEAVKLIAKNKSLVFSGSYYSVVDASSLSCDTQVIEDTTSQIWLSFAFRKHDPLQRLISSALYGSTTVDSYMKRMYKKYSKVRLCPEDGDINTNAVFPLGLYQMQGAGLVLAFGLLLSAFCYAIERCRYGRSNRPKVNMRSMRKRRSSVGVAFSDIKPTVGRLQRLASGATIVTKRSTES